MAVNPNDLRIDRQAYARSLDHMTTLQRHFLTTPVAIVITDAKGSILEANQAFLSFYGYKLDEVVGQNPRILKSGRESPDAYREMWKHIMDPDIGYWTGEIINRKRNGEDVTVVLTVSAVRRADGTISGFVASAVDISQRALIEAQLSGVNRELDELGRLKSELIAVTSQDLRAPLAGITSEAQALADSLDDLTPEEVRVRLQTMVEAGERLTRFVDEILDVERLEAGQSHLSRERHKISSLVGLCVDLQRDQAAWREVELVLDAEEEEYPVRVDSAKLELAITTLLTNAIKFAPKGTKVQVVYKEPEPGVHEISVLDEGPQLPEDALGQIFDRYYELREPGTVPPRAFGSGLGLALVRQIVELHSGTVSAANRPEGGMAFTMSLPETAADSMEGIAALVVDPHDEIYAQLVDQLQAKGITLFFARTPLETRRILMHERPALVFVDVPGSTHELLEMLSQDSNQRGDAVCLVGVGPGVDWDPHCDRWLSTPIGFGDVRLLLSSVLGSDEAQEAAER